MTVISEIFCRSVFFFLLFLLPTLNQTTEESARPNNHPRLLRVSFSPTTSKDAATQYILHYANEVLIIKSARPNRSIATTLGGASSTALFSFHFSLALAYFLFPFKFWFSLCIFRLLHSSFLFYFIFFLVFFSLSFFLFLFVFIHSSNISPFCYSSSPSPSFPRLHLHHFLISSSLSLSFA